MGVRKMGYVWILSFLPVCFAIPNDYVWEKQIIDGINSFRQCANIPIIIQSDALTAAAEDHLIENVVGTQCISLPQETENPEVKSNGIVSHHWTSKSIGNAVSFSSPVFDWFTEKYCYAPNLPDEKLSTANCTSMEVSNLKAMMAHNVISVGCARQQCPEPDGSVANAVGGTIARCHYEGPRASIPDDVWDVIHSGQCDRIGGCGCGQLPNEGEQDGDVIEPAPVSHPASLGDEQMCRCNGNGDIDIGAPENPYPPQGAPDNPVNPEAPSDGDEAGEENPKLGGGASSPQTGFAHRAGVKVILIAGVIVVAVLNSDMNSREK